MPTSQQGHLQNFAQCPAACGSTPALNSSSGPKTFCRVDGEDEWMDEAQGIILKTNKIGNVLQRH